MFIGFCVVRCRIICRIDDVMCLDFGELIVSYGCCFFIMMVGVMLV